MTWLQKLYETYDAVQHLELDGEETVMPISHTLQNAHINIVIDSEGSFKRAQVLEKTQVVLPATESSAGRSSGEAPHPLADKLQYVAQDYAAHGGLKKNYFEGYLKQLNDWINSPYSHLSAIAVHRYVSKGCVIADLVAAQLCYLDESGCLLTRWQAEDIDPPLLFKVLPKEKGTLDQGNALVCWSVEESGKSLVDTWRDDSLQQAWINYDVNKGSEKHFCMVTGGESVSASNHPAKLRHTGDKAKLISANDSSGYTFRGRFLDSEQAARIGFEVTQKAHNALRWLIKRQAYRSGDQVVVSWAISGTSIPQPFSDPDEWDDWGDKIDDLSIVEQIEEAVETGPDHSMDTGRSFAAAFNKKLSGYRSGQNLELTDSIVVMALDSATPGRMGISYYRDFQPKDYLDNLEQWHLDFAWWQRASKDKQEHGKQRWYLAAPSLWSILQAVYGDIIKSNETLKKNLSERLLPSIIEKRPCPKDIMERSLTRVTNRHSYKQDEQWLWEQNLGVACALYKGYFQRHPKKEQRRTYTMALDAESNSRDYLYGRLLALAERLEEVALNASGANRPTTANRLMQRFSTRPYDTWLTIYKQLEPYIRQLKSSRPGFLVNINREIDEVMGRFDKDDYMSPKPLTGEFLLGFHCQRLALHQKNETVNTEETKEGTEA